MDAGEIEKQFDGLSLVVLIPTFSNIQYLHQTINSLAQYTSSEGNERPYFHILILNNGTPEEVSRAMSANPLYTVVDCGENLGWEGALQKGLGWVDLHVPHVPYVMFLNDDVAILPNDPMWLRKMLDVLDQHKDFGMVGPIANFAGAYQNFRQAMPPAAFEVQLLMGFCQVIRLSALKAVGGVTTGLPGGDDVDLSLRMVLGGWRLAVHCGVYVHHYGETTGKRLHPDYWNSGLQQAETRNEMIRRHGLKNYMKAIRFAPKPIA